MEHLEIGSHCIFTGKHDNGFPCRVVAYNGNTVVVRRIPGGYVGVKKEFLKPTTEMEAIQIARKRICKKV